jgi:putative hemolysin
MADEGRRTDARMTVRLDPATRRKVERLAAREGISMNEALNRLLQRAPDQAERAAGRRRYRLKPREVGFGFDIGRVKELAGAMSDAEVIRKLKGRG